MSTISVINAKHPSSASNNIVLDSSGNATFAGTAVPSSSFLRNRIINGDMRIDQRNAGASVTPGDGQYTLDRWVAYRSQASRFSVQQNAGSVTPPAGFTNYLGCTSLSAYSPISTDYFGMVQFVEGFNIADLAWGTASAQPITISFWVRSSLTGTFSFSLKNNADNRGYLATYSIGAANTWEFKSVTIPGDTVGPWLTNNGVGVRIWFDLGSGSAASGTAGVWSSATPVRTSGSTSLITTNGATFYLTGVQLEVGSAATPFERRQFGQELALCQRYFVQSARYWFTVGYDASYAFRNTGGVVWQPFMRTTPTISITAGGMHGHHGVPPVVAGGPNTGGVGLEFNGSGYRANTSCMAYVDMSLNSEL